ncbi:methyltransferase domain-containing protein [Desulfonema magnum]|uniref:SAM-dependent methyltransferase domain-containing protein n=1 Tax=Desulfonema magnum TaxID=45655 RepID=A0A975GRB1_9BACT|nr:methyltransferase domain-containing protein [Desulfonema magnum]QTA90794.1 SAM-dependent methyltransferase domain-containing protein [Desulfonema magnum]
MRTTNTNALANIEFQVRWKSDSAAHTDCYYGQGINFWRDCFPSELYEMLMGKSAGQEAELVFKPGDIVSAYDAKKTFYIKQSQFDSEFDANALTEPRAGRFYPKGILKGIPNVFKENMEPFRCAEVNSQIIVDFNHPLAEKELHLNTRIVSVQDKPTDRGGTCTDWMENITHGPGMQARWKAKPTEFFADDPFVRTEETPDGLFYETPRLVTHIDDTAIQIITEHYKNLLEPGMKVLDLMSSWKSHLPNDLAFTSVTGLGLNREELENNPRLTEHVIHDLNENSSLPFGDETYDAVVCTVSVEYMTRPFEVFEEVARILRQGGYFIVTFSNRWFPPKVVRIWQNIHEFERVGLVTEYFLKSGKFKELDTFSQRGLPRPSGDKYAHELRYSDPVFGVWARKL